MAGSSRPIQGLSERNWKRDLESLNRLRASILVEAMHQPERARAAIKAIDEVIDHVLTLTGGRLKHEPSQYNRVKAV